MKLYTFLLLWLLLLPSLCVQSQTIRLNNLQLETLPNLYEFTALKSLYEQDVVDGSFFALMQFDQLPNTTVRREISTVTGITFLGYLPENTYYVKIPAAIEAARLYNYKVRGIYRMLPAYKLSPQLTGSVLPAHALNADQTIRLNVTYYKGLDQESILKKFAALHISAIPKSALVNVLSITVPVNSIQGVAALPFVQYIEPVSPPGEPENYESRTDHRNNFLQNDYASGLNYNGDGIWIGMNDDGFIGPHIDYTGRLDQSWVIGENNSSNTHGDHVSGILMGGGNLDPRLKGNASGSMLKVYTAYSDLGEPLYEGFYDVPNSYINPGIKINSTSYSDGCNVGYTTLTQTIEQTMLDYPEFIHVFSAGNYGGTNCGPINGWYEITGGHKVAKNCITVGNVDKEDLLATSSSRGPTKDGRMKPEVCAVGTDVNSTQPNNNYGLLSGTSMSCPGVAGTFAILIDAYKDLNGGAYPPSSLLKAALMNTADDLGNAGPDYKYGYGRINARRAYLTLRDKRYLEDVIDQGETKSFPLTVPEGVKEVRVMVYWHDATASLGTPKDLVNDLRLQVTDPTNVTFDPWVLNPLAQKDTLDKPARRSIDTLNNHEQVTIADAPGGAYQITIIGSSIPAGPQPFVIVYEFLYDELTLTYPAGGESWKPGEKEKIRWDSYGGSGLFTLEISSDEGQSWTSVASSIGDTKRFYDYTIPTSATVSGKYKIRVNRGLLSDESDTLFSIISVPAGLTLVSSCPDSVKLSWAAIPNAISYEVFKLGEKFMEPVGTSTTNSISIGGLNPNNEDWLSVRALGTNDAAGRRAIAIKKTTGLINCILSTDAAAIQMEPGAATYTSCMGLNAVAVSMKIKNEGLNPISGFTVNMKSGNSSQVTEFFSESILPGNSANYQFGATADLTGAGTNLLQCWSDMPGDQNPFNDTVSSLIEVLQVASVSIPFYENFETFTLCGTSNNCEAGVCALTNGFTNIVNLSGDDIDWRTNAGPTPGNGTGPDVDFDPATNTGKYLYLEAGGCNFHEALLLTPCIDLSQAIEPLFTFAYHLYGAEMGSLHIDAFANGIWSNDIITPVSGNQGNSWKTDTIDISGYAGNTVTLRFRGITGAASSSDMAIDAIGIFESAEVVQAAFYSAGTLCTDSIIAFTDGSSGNIVSYNWNFGSGAIPSVATTAGPHEIIYTTPGTKQVVLKVTGTSLNNSDTVVIEVNDHPHANFFIDEQH
ncbi:MAG: S8 family serine peptidase, partial [Chitinophagales bacterium]